jgi:isoleucyl-tRNA synthetase
MPVVNTDYINTELEEIYNKLLKVRKEVLRALEVARKEDLIRHPYEARVVLKLPEEYKNLVNERIDWIKYFFTTSQVELADEVNTEVKISGEDIEGAEIGITKAKGEKCPRCWIYDESVGRDGQPICDRCKAQIERMNIDIATIEG